MKHSVRILMLFSLMVSITLLGGCGSSPATLQKLGNTNANITNAGMSVLVDDWIYFMNYADENKLYRIRPDGTSEEKVSDDKMYFLNYADGWIYYCNGEENNSIYKMKPDGTEHTPLVNTLAQNILVSDGWIYYISHSDATPSEFRRILKVRTDGSEGQKVNAQETSAFNIHEDRIYYVSSSDQTLHRIQVDGGEDTRISDTAVSTFCVLGDRIYYLDPTEEKKQLWSMGLDGSEAVKLTEEKVAAFNPSGEWIYYGCVLDEDGTMQLKKMKLDGSEATVLNEDAPVIINVHGDMLVYLSVRMTDSFDFQIQETILRTDGTGRKDYLFVPPAPDAILDDVNIFTMQDAVAMEDYTVTVVSAYATNILRNRDPNFASPIFDDVVDGTHLFVRMVLKNHSENRIDLTHRIGQIAMDESGYAVFWSPMADITDAVGKADPGFHLPRESYSETLFLNPKEMIEVQVWSQMEQIAFPMTLGLFNGSDIEPLAAIDVIPTDEDYVTSWGQAFHLMVDRFPGNDIQQLSGIGFQFEGEDTEKMYYTFMVKDGNPSNDTVYFVERDTGTIYVGGQDEDYPGYEWVPIKLLDP